MPSHQALFLLVITGILIPQFVKADISVIDDKGRNIKLDKPAVRIISLAPHITETLFTAGAGNKIVGTIAHSDYPEAAKNIQRVGGYPTADIEKIISLKPDLIISWPQGNNLKQVEKLKAFGISVFMSEPVLPQDIAKNIKTFGQLAGTSKIAEKAADEFMQHYNSLKSQYANKEKVRVFYQLWNKPIMTINGEHLISKVINLCGGVNVFSNLPSLSPRVSIEAVIASKTDIILAGAKEEKRTTWTAEWNKWLPLAVENSQNIIFTDPDLLNRAGPRILQGADNLCRELDKIRTTK